MKRQWHRNRHIVERPDKSESLSTGENSVQIPSLSTLISAHKACFAKLPDLATISLENETTSRLEIVNYEPSDNGEAMERLAYLFAITVEANNRLGKDALENFLATMRRFI